MQQDQLVAIHTSPVACTFAVENVNFLIFFRQNYPNTLNIILAQQILAILNDWTTGFITMQNHLHCPRRTEQ